VMAYELLLGHVPFRGNSPAVLYQHVHQSPPPLNATDPRLPGPLATAVQRALSKQPEERFASCTEFATALTAAVSPAPRRSLSAAQETLAAERPPSGPYHNLDLAGQRVATISPPDAAPEPPPAIVAPRPQPTPAQPAPTGSRRT